jgi:hypothetical protein
MLVHKKPFDRLTTKMLPILIGWLPETERDMLEEGILRYNWALETTEQNRDQLFALTETPLDTPLRRLPDPLCLDSIKAQSAPAMFYRPPPPSVQHAAQDEETTEQFTRHVRDRLQIARQNVDQFYTASAAREEDRRAQNAANISESQARQQAREYDRREKQRRRNTPHHQQTRSIFVDDEAGKAEEGGEEDEGNDSWFRADTEFPSDKEVEYRTYRKIRTTGR